MARIASLALASARDGALEDPVSLLVTIRSESDAESLSLRASVTYDVVHNKTERSLSIGDSPSTSGAASLPTGPLKAGQDLSITLHIPCLDTTGVPKNVLYNISTLSVFLERSQDAGPVLDHKALIIQVKKDEEGRLVRILTAPGERPEIPKSWRPDEWEGQPDLREGEGEEEGGEAEGAAPGEDDS